MLWCRCLFVYVPVRVFACLSDSYLASSSEIHSVFTFWQVLNHPRVQILTKVVLHGQNLVNAPKIQPGWIPTASWVVENAKTGKVTSFAYSWHVNRTTEGCPIYPHRVGSSKLRIDLTYRKSSRERLSVKHSKVMREGCKSRQLDSSRLESSRLVRVKVDSTYRKSSRERLSVKHSKVMREGCKSRQLDSSRLESSRLVRVKVDSCINQCTVNAVNSFTKICCVRLRAYARNPINCSRQFQFKEATSRGFRRFLV